MGSKYTSQATSGYNAAPPADDGSQVAANKITWATIKTKLSDVLKTFGEAINTALVNFTDFSSVTTSTNLSTDATHHMKTIEVTSGSPTISLGQASTMTNNYIVTVTNSGTGAPVIALATATDTLDGTVNGTFTFPTGTKTSFTFKVNNAANGYYTEVAGGKDSYVYGTLTTAKVVITTAIGKIVPGATSLSLRNNADAADNILVADAGAITLRGAVSGATTLSLSGPVTLTAAASKVIPGATSLSLRNNADNADNVLVSDAGNVTLRGTLTGPSSMLAPITNSLGGDVSLNNSANYFDGPSVAQGTSGTWFVSGTVLIADSISGPIMHIKLWDGTTVIASCASTGVSGQNLAVSLSGFITSPAGNLRISVKETNATTGKIFFNTTGNSKDSTITAIRIA